MDFSDLLRHLPIDDKLLRRLPVPGLHGSCLLEIDLTRGVLEVAPSSPIEALRRRHSPGLRTLVDGLREAASDPKVVGLIAHAGGTQVGLTQADELRRAVLDFRRSGKPTLAWSESFGEITSGMAAYLFASAFEQIWLQPTGDLGMSGVALEPAFLRGAFDKLGIEPQFAQRYEYKSAADTYMAESLTEPHREMLARIADSLLDGVLTDVAAARSLPLERVREAVDQAPLTAAQALEFGLVDHLGYRDEAFAAMRARLGDAEEETELRFVERYRKNLPGVASVTHRGRPVVAVVRADGAIHLGRSGRGGPMGGHSIGSDTLGAALRAVGRDDDVKAVVLRIDSPGGSYVASDAVRREVLNLRESGRPVIASMAGVAASGGYFIAMPCTEIVANPATLTGSIGVLAGKLVVAGGLSRLGINREIVSAGANAAMFSGQRPFDEEQWRKLDQWLDLVYADFTAKAAHDRGMPLERLEPLARGRVWTGADAAERGLVDHLGGLERALERACEAAGLDRDGVEARVLPKFGPLDRFSPADNSDTPAAAFLGEGVSFVDQARAALGLDQQGVLTMPDIELR